MAGNFIANRKMRTRGVLCNAIIIALDKKIYKIFHVALYAFSMKVLPQTNTRTENISYTAIYRALLSSIFIIDCVKYFFRFFFFVFFLSSHTRASNRFCFVFRLFIFKIYNRKYIYNKYTDTREEMRTRNRKKKTRGGKERERERRRLRLICKWKGTEIEFYVRIELAIFFSRIEAKREEVVAADERKISRGNGQDTSRDGDVAAVFKAMDVP